MIEALACVGAGTVVSLLVILWGATYTRWVRPALIRWHEKEARRLREDEAYAGREYARPEKR